jgi:hypothetical protein
VRRLLSRQLAAPNQVMGLEWCWLRGRATGGAEGQHPDDEQAHPDQGRASLRRWPQDTEDRTEQEDGGGDQAGHPQPTPNQAGAVDRQRQRRHQGGDRPDDRGPALQLIQGQDGAGWLASATLIRAVSAALETKPMATKTPPLTATATARASCPARQMTGTSAARNGMKASKASPTATSLATSAPRWARL